MLVFIAPINVPETTVNRISHLLGGVFMKLLSRAAICRAVRRKMLPPFSLRVTTSTGRSPKHLGEKGAIRPRCGTPTSGNLRL